MPEKRIKQLENRVAELEEFRKATEQFIRKTKLYDILYENFDALELTKEFEGHPVGHYCKRCFAENGEFHPIKRTPAKFQSQVGMSPGNAVCTNCNSTTTVGTAVQNRYFKSWE